MWYYCGTVEWRTFDQLTSFRSRNSCLVWPPADIPLPAEQGDQHLRGWAQVGEPCLPPGCCCKCSYFLLKVGDTLSIYKPVIMFHLFTSLISQTLNIYMACRVQESCNITTDRLSPRHVCWSSDLPIENRTSPDATGAAPDHGDGMETMKRREASHGSAGCGAAARRRVLGRSRQVRAGREGLEVLFGSGQEDWIRNRQASCWGMIWSGQVAGVSAGVWLMVLSKIHCGWLRF